MMSSQHEWSPAQGLAKAALSLILRAILALAVWCGVLWGVSVLQSQGISIHRLGLIIGVVPGILIAVIMTRRLAEQAGMVSWLLMVMAVVTTLVVIAAGLIIMAMIVINPATMGGFGLLLSTTIIALMLGVKNTILDN